VRRAASAASLLAALVLGACGGDDDSEARRACEAEARNAAQAAVIAEAFEQGKLGTQAEVLEHFRPDDRLFDEQGRMRPYSELQGLTRARFNSYRASSAIPGDVQGELAAARRRVDDAGYPGC
jgi:hypothetical protein